MKRGKSASRSEDNGESVPRGTARRTLDKARFFLRLADYSERRRDGEGFECYVEAAVLFGQSALEHLKKEMGFLKPGKKKSGRYEEFKNWIELCERNPLIEDLERKRNALAHQRPTSTVLVPSDETDILYGPLKEVYEKLPAQLAEIEAIIDECEKRFK